MHTAPHQLSRRSPFGLRCVSLIVLAAFAAGVALAQPNDDLAIAAANDRVAQVKELLSKGASANATDTQGDPVLLIAARAGSAGSVDVLLAGGANVNARNPGGDSALMAAAISGNLGIARTLRAKGAELEGPAWTPLIYAATGGQDAMVNYLLAEGAKINAVSPNGTTALMMAVREGKFQTAMLLINKGADVKMKNQNGATALSWATRGNDKALADALRRAGATE